MREGQRPRSFVSAVRQQDRLWRDLLAGRSLSFRNLINSSYVYHYLAAAWDARERGHQMLVAKNPDEELIFRHASEESARAGIPLDAVTGFYVHPQVVVTETEFSGASRILHECKDGCEPATVAAAVGLIRG
jgi:hypothetical protein